MNINIAREQANVFHRSQRLFEDGYTIETGATLAKPEPRHITSPAGQTYIVDPLIGTWTRPYFINKNLNANEFGPFVPCKHILGADKLEKDQIEAEMMEVAFRCGIDWE